MFKLALHWQILIGMVAGAVLGIWLNAFHGTAETTLRESLPAGIERLDIRDSADRTTFRLTQDDGTTETLIVDPSLTKSRPDEAAQQTKRYSSFDRFAREYPDLAQIYTAEGQSRAKFYGGWFQRIGQLFLRMLQMVAVPLIITSLLTGIMGLGDAGQVGRMFGRTIGYYATTSLIAICTGLAAVNIVRPGLKKGAEAAPEAFDGGQGTSSLGAVLFEQLEALIPANPMAALVEPNFLSIIAFTLAVAIIAIRIGGDSARTIRHAAQAGFDVMMAMTTLIIRLAPLGVFFLMLYVTATQGFDVFRSLAWYMLAVVAALLVHAGVTLPLILWFVAKRNPWEYARAMSPALLTAFSSASSNGTLPLTLSNVEKRAGISNRTGSFVLPLGATINMDGTALYEAVAVLFIAQLHHGANLPWDQQMIVVFTALLASIGAAGIPHAGLVMMVIILQAVNLPIELQGVILAVDRVLDMARTSVNVWSDSCGCAVVEAFENPS